MKKIFFVAFAMMMAMNGCKAGVQGENSVAAGNVVQEIRNVGEFNGVTLIGSHKVVCTPGKDYSVVVEAPKEAAGRLLTEVKNGMLTISKEKIAGVRVVTSNKDDEKTTVYVTLPKLQIVHLMGSGDIIVKGKTEYNEKLRVSLVGSGNIEFDDIDVNFSDISLAGSGDIKINSIKTKLVELKLTGSGDMDVRNVYSDNTKVSLAGSGDVHVGQVKGSNVAVSSTGSGDMKVDNVDCAMLNINHVSSCDVTIGNVKAVTTNVSKVGSGDLKLAGKTVYYNEVKHGSGKVDKGSLRYDKTKQKMQGGWQIESSGTTLPNGIEAEP